MSGCDITQTTLFHLKINDIYFQGMAFHENKKNISRIYLNVTKNGSHLMASSNALLLMSLFPPEVAPPVVVD